MNVEQPDWGELLTTILRYYPGYTLETCGDLTWPQLNALLKGIKKRPWSWVVQVEPKESH